MKAKFNGKDIDVKAFSPAAREQLAKKLNDQEEPPRPGPTTSLEVECLKVEVQRLKKENKALESNGVGFLQMAASYIRTPMEVGIPLELHRAISTCLHPDKPTPTDEQRAHAFALWTSFTHDLEKVSRATKAA
jgi:hypothetical protein